MGECAPSTPCTPCAPQSRRSLEGQDSMQDPKSSTSLTSRSSSTFKINLRKDVDALFDRYDVNRDGVLDK